MQVLLLVFLKECHFLHAQSFHVLNQLHKLKLYCIAFFGISFRYQYEFLFFKSSIGKLMTLLDGIEVLFTSTLYAWMESYSPNYQ